MAFVPSEPGSPPPPVVARPLPMYGEVRVLVTGGAGFLGSHLVDRLLEEGYQVLCLDNFFTGDKSNVAGHLGNPRFELIRHDVVDPCKFEVDQIYHLACPASPVHYKHNPIKTAKTSFLGTMNMLGIAKRVGARLLLASTSEVYGDPLQHPQREDYNGNVNALGPRACYDEGKRVAETLCMDYHRQNGVDVRIARIFNTYGPRMNLDDGRVVSNFMAQALRGQDLTIFGSGQQTRSFQYVTDCIDGLIRVMNGPDIGPYNIGNPIEFTIIELAREVIALVNPNLGIVDLPKTEDDPAQRKPDIEKARRELGWEPTTPLREGLGLMLEDFRARVLAEDAAPKGSWHRAR